MGATPMYVLHMYSKMDRGMTLVSMFLTGLYNLNNHYNERESPKDHLVPHYFIINPVVFESPDFAAHLQEALM